MEAPTVILINGLVLSSSYHWNPGPGCETRKAAASREPSSRRSKRRAAAAAPTEAGAQLEAVVSVDPSPSWGPGQKGHVFFPAGGLAAQWDSPKPDNSNSWI